MNVDGFSEIALLTIIHRWPVILSTIVPSGNGDFFERDLTCKPRNFVAFGE